MAKQKGVFKIEGTLDDVTFFKRRDAYLVRNKGGVSKQRIMNDPAFARTRENGAEFTNVAHSGKMIRNANSVLIRKAYDGTLSNRLMKVLALVKNEDANSSRGNRTVYEGLLGTAGKNLLKGFDFNSRSQLTTVLQAPFVLDIVTGKVTVEDLVPLDMMAYPQNSTHVNFRTGFLNLDLETGAFEITYSPVVTLPLDMTVSSPEMLPTAVPAGTGTQFYFFLIEFMQEVNGVQYALNDGKFNVLSLLDVV